MEHNPIYAKKPVITYLLIAANILLWLLETAAGGSGNIDVAMKFGALYTPYVMQYGQWWRIVTSMFLHFGIDHLASNMISLGAIGPYAEWYYGKAGMLFLYFAGGISGNLLTIAVENRSGDYGISAGASGAIFGLVSIFIIFALTPGLRRIFPMKRVILAIVLMLLPGFYDHSISMTAHAGGLLGGSVMALVLLPLRAHREHSKGW